MRLLASLIVCCVLTAPVVLSSSTSLTTGAGDLQETQQPKQTDEFVPISQLPAQDQLPAAPLLVTAYSFVWVVLFAYVASVGRRLTKVQQEVQRLESDIAKRTRT